MASFTQIYSSSDIEELNSNVTNYIENQLIELCQKQETVVLALCGGRSVGAIFELLGKGNATIKWDKVHIFMVDERAVQIDNPESNYKIVNDILVSQLKSKNLINDDTNLHPFILDKSSQDFGAGNYTASLLKFGGLFDIALLSAGEDGHIGALYPNHHSIQNETEGYIYLNDSPKPPPERITASYKLLAKTKIGVLLAFGTQKHHIVRKLMDTAVSHTDCPAKLVMDLPISCLATTHSLNE